MEITYTENAVREIAPWLQENHTYLKLMFDTEGCGCAVNGIPTLMITHEQGPYDMIIKGQPFDLLMQRNHEVYFEEKMTIDFSVDQKSFILKSNGQIYNASMRLITVAP
ncbi:hypothetical protein NV379_03095 [Paenibacillus sp. N1-5-1-14]|uniref:iron-sulfur cluster biosynthesis family protein n=1 Tax=Paenibacillus radicibacter TaxID=2972488 RepID=UPI0021590ADE|nr:iron-sulfur cluster biosynthesis family protein [Paenibacillus radicibacter]MCR8641634.1 hypothetical protein [Paenibacillus radicibacter]